MGDEGFKEGLPRRAGSGGVFVGEVDKFDAVVAAEAGEFGGEFDRIAMAPGPPETVLAAVMAMMGATA